MRAKITTMSNFNEQCKHRLVINGETTYCLKCGDLLDGNYIEKNDYRRIQLTNYNPNNTYLYAKNDND